MKMIIAITIDANDKPAAYSAVDAFLVAGILQGAVRLTDGIEITSAVSRPDVVHVGFIVEQATGRTTWSKAFTTQAAARTYADRVSAQRCTNVHGESLTFVGRVESYEVCE